MIDLFKVGEFNPPNHIYVDRRRACHLRQDRVGDSSIYVNVVGMIAVYYSPIGLSSADISITGLSNEIVILQILDSSVTIYFCGSSRNEKKRIGYCGEEECPYYSAAFTQAIFCLRLSYDFS